MKYKNYDEGEEGEIIRLNSISEIKFTDGDESLCILNNSFIDYKEDDSVTWDEELQEFFDEEDDENVDLDVELSLGTEEVEFISSIGKDSIENILFELPLELNYTEFFHNKIIMNDIMWSKKTERGKKEYSYSFLNPAPSSIPEKNSKGEQFWNVITKCHYDE